MINKPTPRNYQVATINQAREAMRRKIMNLLIVLGTGGGKTTIAAEMILAAVMKGKKVLFVAHRRELILQAHARLQQYGIQAGIIMGSKHKYIGDSVNVASVQTLVNREFPEADLVYIDEAHHFVLEGIKPPKPKDLHSWQQVEAEPEAKPSIYKKVFDHYNRKAFIIGLTATPKRLDGKPLGNIFEEMLIPEVDGNQVDIAWLQDQGYLVECRYFGAPIEPDLSDLKKTANGDFSVAKLAEKFDKKELYEGVVENYLKYGKGKKCIVFCTDIPSSKKTMAEFEAHGISAGHLDSYLKDHERDSVLYQFKEGYIDILLNVGILTEGYDLPDIEMMIAFRGTASESLWLQMIGRILRAIYAPGSDLSTAEGRKAGIAASHKPHAIVLDHGTNCRRLGFAEDRREYSLDLADKKKAGVTPIKECKVRDGGCGALLGVSVRLCPECGREFDLKAEAAALKKAEFVELKPTKESLPDNLRKPIWQMNIPELEEYRAFMKNSIAWVERELRYKAKARANATNSDPMKVFEAILQEYADIETPKKKRYSREWIFKNLDKMAAELINA